MEIEVQLDNAQLLEAVRGHSGLEIARSTLFRWRQKLGYMEPPYGKAHVQALSHYGQQMKLRVSHPTAYRRTVEYLQSIGL